MPRPKKNSICREQNCVESPYLGGYCRAHHDDYKYREELRRAAVSALWELTVDHTFFTQKEYREEAYRISKWWAQACAAVISPNPKDTVFAGEAEYATEWCIRLAEQLVLAERAARSGTAVEEYRLKAVSEWVWERFTCLERGLSSNGMPRSVV